MRRTQPLAPRAGRRPLPLATRTTQRSPAEVRKSANQAQLADARATRAARRQAAEDAAFEVAHAATLRQHGITPRPAIQESGDSSR